jgi:tetratricopeptide (TPR) repeat protein
MFTSFLMGLAFLLNNNNLFSQNVQSKPNRQSSIEAFSRGDFELAYREFNELLIIYPKDPWYKYYSGVCLVKLSIDPVSAVTLLKGAQQGAAIVRTIPSDALFWLGRAQQMSGYFAEAIVSYNTFTEQSGKKSARELEIPDYIQQCNERIGQLKIPETISVIGNKSELETGGENSKSISDSLKNSKTGKSLVPDDYDILLSDALDYQLKADSLYKIAEEHNKSLEKLNYKEKTEMRAVIAETENLASLFQQKADQKYVEAQTRMNVTAFVTVKTLKQNLAPTADSSVKKDQIADTTIKEIKTRVSQTPKPEVTQAVKKPAEVFSVFEVITKPAPATNKKILINPEVPPGLTYRIQTAVFRNPVALSYFKGLSPVYGFKIAGTDKTNYYVGMFRRLADANRALAVVRQKGFKDSFVVSLSGGKAISSDRASILEKEWGKKPFINEMNSTADIPADTIPPTLSLRVEVARSQNPVKDDILEGMKKMAGSRGLDIETLSDGSIVYLIGKFVTFESAEEYSGLLTRNGYRDAKVVAWLGKKEIPVETARQLFEKIE